MIKKTLIIIFMDNSSKHYFFIIKAVFTITVFVLCSCSQEPIEQENGKNISKISTAINVEQIKSSTNQNISKSRSQVPQMRTVRIQGSLGGVCFCALRLHRVL